MCMHKSHLVQLCMLNRIVSKFSFLFYYQALLLVGIIIMPTSGLSLGSFYKQ